MVILTANARGGAKPDAPDGFNVPGLDSLLSTTAMLESINGLLPEDRAPFTDCALVNLRYKTSSSCLASYRLTRHGDESPGGEETYVYARGFSRPQFEMARPKIPTTRWVDSVDGPSVSLLPKAAAILYWYPNDERLHGLRRITVKKKLQRVFYEQLSDYPPDTWRISDRSIRLQVVRYKPERRAVIRCRFRAHRHSDNLRQERFVYVGVYEDGRDRYLWDLLQDLHRESAHGGWAVPTPLAWISEYGALVSDTLKGVPLQEVMETGSSAGEVDMSLQAAAAALARLHNVSLTRVPVYSVNAAQDQLETTRDMLARLVPESAHDATVLTLALGDSLRKLDSHTRGFVHGDLHARQIMVDGDTVGFLDFDRAQIGDPVQDLGNFRAQLWLNSDIHEGETAETRAQSFIAHYLTARGDAIPVESINTWTAVSLFHSALRPIGRMEDGWRARVGEILKRAGAVLQ